MTATPPNSDRAEIRRRLLAWYRKHRRDLPWRQPLPDGNTGRDPYPVWISEIMLQQTRVVAAIPYYRRFLDRFPDVATLAAAPVADVLAIWSGLGYYRRARMLHQAAQVIATEHGGQFPLDPDAVRHLPGIGTYTTGAILSIAAGLPLTAVDGNAARIASRLLGRSLSVQQATPYVDVWLSRRRPGEFNQALMDLGATVCLPRQPECGRCPLRRLCRSANGHCPPPARAPLHSHPVTVHLQLARLAGRVLLVQRHAGAGQLAGLWELPSLPVPPPGREPLLTVRHQITNRSITARVYAGRGNEGQRTREWGGAPRDTRQGTPRWLVESSLDALPLTGLTRKVLRRIGRLAPAHIG